MGDKFPGNSRKFAKHGTLYCEKSIDPDGWMESFWVDEESRRDNSSVARTVVARSGTAHPWSPRGRTAVHLNPRVPGRSLGSLARFREVLHPVVPHLHHSVPRRRLSNPSTGEADGHASSNGETPVRFVSRNVQCQY